jgi:hypothetical protein
VIHGFIFSYRKMRIPTATRAQSGLAATTRIGSSSSNEAILPMIDFWVVIYNVCYLKLKTKKDKESLGGNARGLFPQPSCIFFEAI